MSHAEAVLITDFRPVVEPTAGLQFLPYQLGEHQGHMLRLNSDRDTPAVLPSPVSGWHEIHIGFMGASGLQLRLSGEPCFRWVESLVQWDGNDEQGEETFWQVADLSARHFEFLPQMLERRYDQRQAQIAYLRLVPTDPNQSKEQLQKRRTTQTAGAVIDGHEMFGTYAPQNPDQVRGLLMHFVDSDFKRICFGCTCTTMRLTYLSQVGYYLGQDQDLNDLHSDANRRCAQTLKQAEKTGVDPLDIMIEFCRENNLELWPSFRIQQDYPYDYAGGFGHDFNSPFTAVHQDWRHVDRHGQVCSHLFSHFHRGWQDYKLDLLAELAAKGPAGIHLNLMCEINAIWDFAPHAVERFKKAYDLDPTASAEPPEEWYQFRCDHLTEFMQRLRHQTDEIGAGLGRKIRLAVQVSGEWAILTHGKKTKAVAQNFLAGFDIGRWAREDLVDVISPSFRRTYRPMFLEHLQRELGAAREQIGLVPSLGQHDNALFPPGYDWGLYFTDEGAERTDLMPFGELDAWRVLREAHDLYRQGADAVDVWEMGHAPVRLSRWNALKNIGDRPMLAETFGDRIGGLLDRPDHPLQFTLK